MTDPYAHCEAALREGDRDRWLACMFAPPEKRPFLHALYAFNLEVSRVAAQVSQALLGEMRLQFWIDLLNGEMRGDARANPVADALLRTLETCRLDPEPLRDLLQARRCDLYDEPHENLAALDLYCDLTAGGLFRLAGQILAGDKATGAAAEPAGRAYALTGLLRALPWLEAERKTIIPADLSSRPDALALLRAHARENLAQTRMALNAVTPQERPAYRVMALPKLFLAQMDRAADPCAPLPEIPQWRRQWALLWGKI